MNVTKLVIKLFIIAYAMWRIILSTIHIIKNDMVLSNKTTLSYAILVMSLLLLTATLIESKLLLEIWMICFILKFGAIIFSVFNFDIEENSLFPKRKAINTILTSIIQLVVLVLVMTLYKSIDEYDRKASFESTEDCTSSDKSKKLCGGGDYELQQTSQNVDEAVSYEPVLFILST
ncbi:hypothetical protein PVAND_010530 [Polypedilum vanderplanki]|uniref:Uncharacterized protein n=1 Tax=Polypedilum vanderplanki TaxID=319348 RepID=A0A9J6CGV4_POLVA|nr:hypothetical protein PVAND_010530 [Polypedilum vanderplanki]